MLVAGAGVTGRSVLAALAPLDVRADDLTDDNPAALRTLAEHGGDVVDADSAAAARRRLRPGRHQSRVAAELAGAGGRRGRRHPGLGRRRVGLAARPAGRYGPPRRWLVVTGTNGKTTTTSMLQAMLHRRRARQRAVRQHRLAGDRRARPAPARCWPSSCPASSCTGRRRCGRRPAWCSTSPRTTWTGTARWPLTRRHKARALDGRVAVAGSTTRSPRGCWPPRPPVRGRLPAGRTRAGWTRRARRHAGGPRVRGDAGLRGSAPVASIPVAGPVGVLDALAAAALARAVGVPRRRRGRRWRPSRWAGTAPRWSAVVDGVTYVDDSKATNPHAAAGLAAGLPAGGVGGRRPAQGRVGRRYGRAGGGSAGRRGAARPRSTR